MLWRAPGLQSASGPGLAFIVFAEAALHMPGAPVWAALFFGMLFTLGLSSMFGNMESIVTPLLDMGMLPRGVPKEAFTGKGSGPAEPALHLQWSTLLSSHSGAGGKRQDADCLPLSPGLICLVCLLASTCFTLQSGSYWLEIFDSYVASLNLIVFAFFEVVGVVYIYGLWR